MSAGASVMVSGSSRPYEEGMNAIDEGLRAREGDMKYRLLVLALATFAIGTDNYVVAGILPQVADHLHVSVGAAGQFVTFYSLAYALGAPIAATVTANWPSRRALLVGLAVFVVGNILTATTHTFELALASRAVAGLGGAIVTPVAGATAAAMVAPTWRGRALAIVLAGLTCATALGAPLGTLVASTSDWRTTMWFVAGLGGFACVATAVVLPVVPRSSSLRLKDRLAPLADARVVATLATTLLGMFGQFLVYTYLSVVFERVTAGDGKVLAMLMSIWGSGATVGILGGGRLADRFGSRPVIAVAIAIVTIDFLLVPWSSAHFGGAAISLAIWGASGYAFGVSQQHRLVAIAPTLAPVLIALNSSAIYLAVSASSSSGAVLLRWLPPLDLPFVGAVGLACGLVIAEVAPRLHRASPSGSTTVVSGCAEAE